MCVLGDQGPRPERLEWPNLLSKEDVDDLKDSLKILERKISRSVTGAAKEQTDES